MQPEALLRHSRSARRHHSSSSLTWDPKPERDPTEDGKFSDSAGQTSTQAKR